MTGVYNICQYGPVFQKFPDRVGNAGNMMSQFAIFNLSNKPFLLKK